MGWILFFPALLLVNVFCHSNKTKLEYLGTGSGTRDGDNDNCAEENSEKTLKGQVFRAQGLTELGGRWEALEGSCWQHLPLRQREKEA